MHSANIHCSNRGSTALLLGSLRLGLTLVALDAAAEGGDSGHDFLSETAGCTQCGAHWKADFFIAHRSPCAVDLQSGFLEMFGRCVRAPFYPVRE